VVAQNLGPHKSGNNLRSTGIDIRNFENCTVPYNSLISGTEGLIK